MKLRIVKNTKRVMRRRQRFGKTLLFALYMDEYVRKITKPDNRMRKAAQAAET